MNVAIQRVSAVRQYHWIKCDRDSTSTSTSKKTVSGMGSQYWDNPHPDYQPLEPSRLLSDDLAEPSDAFKKKILQYEEKQLIRLRTELQHEVFACSSIYTGSCGVALLFYRLACRTSPPDHNLLMEAANYLTLDNLRGRRVTFLCGDAGPLALGAIVSHFLGKERPKFLPAPHLLCRKLVDLLPVVEHHSTPDEFLYGRAGYLFSLLYVNKETEQQYVQSDVICKVLKMMLQSGQKLSISRQCHDTVPLLYEWHDSYYLGSAHGTAGILYIFLQAVEYLSSDDLRCLVQPTLDWLLQQRYSSGNLASSLGSRGDRLVQWCHGAPGLVQLACIAHKIFKKQEYLDAALQCGEVTWARGLCTKGYSLCHGVSGNAYTFVTLYQYTKDVKHLYRACKFAEWCIEEKPGTELHAPDAPASLFEGLAGRLFFLCDFQDPLTARFPGYTV